MMAKKKAKIVIEDICPLYSFCPSPSKSADWVCLKGGAERAKSCAVYVGYVSLYEPVMLWIEEETAKSKALRVAASLPSQ
jgi:hypothetical protein